jgi:Fe-Mn family superoxide dismutase
MYQANKYEHLLGLTGFSDGLLANHFTLYEGYVKNFNLLDETLMGMEKAGKFGAPEYAELNRRLGWEFNGMRLHELYFENMSKTPSSFEEAKSFAQAIEKEFGDKELWEKDFRAMGAMRGIGWVILYQDKMTGRVFNVWVNEHDTGHFAGCAPLLVMDVFEHAFMLDYGLKRADYIDVFFRSIDWTAVEKRLGSN